jgi:hypothetical protein
MKVVEDSSFHAFKSAKVIVKMASYFIEPIKIQIIKFILLSGQHKD